MSGSTFGTRMRNGVRARNDRAGDDWARDHREALGHEFHMNDLDAAMGAVAFGINGQDRLFAEYAPDSFANRNKAFRRFGVVALFDRKSSLRLIESPASSVSTQFYLHLCRALASQQQGAPPRFFFVIGSSEPWTMRELDIHTGEVVGEDFALTRANWREVWDVIGLTELRSTLRRTLGA